MILSEGRSLRTFQKLNPELYHEIFLVLVHSCQGLEFVTLRNSSKKHIFSLSLCVLFIYKNWKVLLDRRSHQCYFII